MKVRIACPCGQLLEAAPSASAAANCPRCGTAVGIPRVGILAARKPPPVERCIPPASPSVPQAKRAQRNAVALLVLGLLLMVGTITYRFVRADPQAPSVDAPAAPTIDTSSPNLRSAPAELINPDEPVYLSWRLDRSFRQEWTCHTQQRFKTPQQDGEVSYRSQFTSMWVPLPRPLEQRHLVQRFERAQLHMKNGFQSLQFDSSGDDRTTALAELLRAASLSFDIQPDGKVARVDGADDLLDDIEESAPELLPVFEPCLNADAQKHLAEGLFGALPDRKMKPGESWVRQKQLPPMLGGRLAGPYRFTFEGRDDRLVRIRLQADLVFHADQPAESAAPSATTLKGHVTGALWFDPAKERIVRSEIERRIEGKAFLSSEDGGTTWVEITNVQKAQIRIEDGP